MYLFLIRIISDSIRCNLSECWMDCILVLTQPTLEVNWLDLFVLLLEQIKHLILQTIYATLNLVQLGLCLGETRNEDFSEGEGHSEDGRSLFKLLVDCLQVLVDVLLAVQDTQFIKELTTLLTTGWHYWTSRRSRLVDLKDFNWHTIHRIKGLILWFCFVGIPLWRFIKGLRRNRS